MKIRFGRIAYLLDNDTFFVSPFFNPVDVFQIVIPTERAERTSGGIRSTRFARSRQACGQSRVGGRWRGI